MHRPGTLTRDRAAGRPKAGAGLAPLSFDAYLKFIEDDFLGGERLDPATDGRPDARPIVREAVPQLGDLAADFDFSQARRAALLLPTAPSTDLRIGSP